MRPDRAIRVFGAERLRIESFVAARASHTRITHALLSAALLGWSVRDNRARIPRALPGPRTWEQTASLSGHVIPASREHACSL